MDQQSSAPDPGTLPASVATRRRHDGWTPDKQHSFIEALAETGCVTEACAAVGMAPKAPIASARRFLSTETGISRKQARRSP